MVQAAEALGLDRSTVSRASEYHDRPYVEFCRQLGFPRRNREDAHKFLLDWLGNDAHCPIPSGWNRRCYTGSPELMWAEYAAASLASSVAPLQFEAFHEVRRRERVGIRSGDIFINRDEVELIEIRAKIEKGEATTEEWQERIDELEKNLAFCKERKLYYREAHQNLEGNTKKMVITLDFTATQTGMSDKFHDFVVVVCTDASLQLPADLTDSVIQPERPPMKKFIEKPVLEKRKRRKKEEVQQLGGGRKLLPSFNQSLAKEKREPQLPQQQALGKKYKPCSTVFHFVLRRTDDTPGQTSPYVQWAMDYLLVLHDLGKDFEEIHLFSDGCGKHFKTYPTHWYDSIFSLFMVRYLADLQQRLRGKRSNGNNSNGNNNNSPNIRQLELRIHWDFLPPGDAHNRCDGAAAHWKQPQKKLVRDFAVLTTVGHLAFACARLKNCYLIEAECDNFPDPLECVIEEPWMREAFHFDYGVPETAMKQCGHQNKKNYACCKKTPKLLPCVMITIEDREHVYKFFTIFFSYVFTTLFIGDRATDHTLWLDEEQKRDDELDSLVENEFWDSPSRRRYHSVQGPRISQLSRECTKIYDYENNDDEYDEEYYIDDDYIAGEY